MDLPQCWAYNTSGERCEKHAGHPGQHAITRSWTDAECASPAGQPKPQGKPLIEVFAEEEAKPAKCVACQHQHKGGACRCGCYEYVG